MQCDKKYSSVMALQNFSQGVPFYFDGKGKGQDHNPIVGS